MKSVNRYIVLVLTLIMAVFANAKGIRDKRIGEPVCFTATSASGVSVSLSANGIAPIISMEYSTDKQTWETYEVGTTITVSGLNSKVYFAAAAGGNDSLGVDITNYHYFTLQYPASVSGDLSTLLDRKGGVKILRHNYSFTGLFVSCVKLEDASELLMMAESLSRCCYYNMFSTCTSLRYAPSLPAMSLAPDCYGYMFGDCSSLRVAPELPATRLKESCYGGMFFNCKSLTHAPALPATTLALTCYKSMFEGCYNIRYMNVSFTSWGTIGSTPTAAWLLGVGAEGSFICPTELDLQTRSANRVPTSWFVSLPTAAPLTDNPLCFTSEETGDCNIQLLCHTNGASLPNVELIYSYDKQHWYTYTVGQRLGVASKGQKIYFAASSTGNATLGIDSANYYYFAADNLVSLSGDLTTLLASGGQIQQLTQPFTFTHLFAGLSQLVDAHDLLLVSGKLSPSCYQNMFAGTSLKYAPVLPAISLAEYCYSSMFEGSSLCRTPQLPAMTLTKGCYQTMFANCNSLTAASKLPALSLDSACYESMFAGCTALHVAPILPATMLAKHCYQNMFTGCTVLNRIEVGFNSWTSETTNSWVDGVAAKGSFLCSQTLAEVEGISNIPQDWFVSRVAMVPSAQQPLCFTSLRSTGTEVSLSVEDNSVPEVQLIFSFDTIHWYTYNLNQILGVYAQNENISVAANGTNGNFGNEDQSKSYIFHIDGLVKVNGDITTLLSGAGNVLTLTDNYALAYLFSESDGLVDASDLILPSTTLTKGCYEGMFSNCQHLRRAPRIIAAAAATDCYKEMFANCRQLSWLEVNFSNWPMGSTDSWVQNVAQNGTFVSPVALPLITSTSNIPTGWIVSNPTLAPATENPLCFTALVDTGFVMSLNSIGTGSTVQLIFSFDKVNWYTYTLTNQLLTALHKNEAIYMAASAVGNTDFSTPTALHVFSTTDSVAVSGDLTTLLSATGNVQMLSSEGIFNMLFSNNTYLVDASQLLLPSLTLSKNCYQQMFAGCERLQKAPALPALSLAEGCYSKMFSHCTSLKTMDTLSAVNMQKDCYRAMFFACPQLEKLALMGRNLADSCFVQMFAFCTSLDSLTVDFVDWFKDKATSGWLTSASEDGILLLPCDFNDTIAVADTKLPDMWDVSYRCPELVVDTLPVVADKTYDSNTKTSILIPGTLSGALKQHTVSLCVDSAIFVDKNVGTHKDVTLFYSLTGKDAYRYPLAKASDTLKASINPFQLVMTGTDVNHQKTYDGDTTAQVKMGTSNKFDGDQLTISAMAYFNSKNAGKRNVTVQYSISGADSLNYLAPANLVDTGTIFPKKLVSTGLIIQDTRVYDATTQSLVLDSGHVDTLATDYVSIHVAANYSDKMVGDNKNVTVHFSLSGQDSANYTAPTDLALLASITAKQLTLSGAKVDSLKMYDTTAVAVVLSQAVTSDIIVGDTVSVLTSAAFNSPQPADNKLITVYYTLSGKDASNYLTIDSFVYCTTGKILDEVKLSDQEGEFLIPQTGGYCQNEVGDLSFELESSVPTSFQYKVDFAQTALQAGFKNQDWTDIQSATQVDLIVPDSIADGTYQATVTFRNELKVESQPYSFEFSLNINKNMLKQMFSDVITFDNVAGYSAFQWYHDGVAIPGATLPYYQQKGGLSGEYYLEVMTADSLAQKVRTCMQSFVNGQQQTAPTAPQKVVRDGYLYIVMPDGTNYDARGVKL